MNMIFVLETCGTLDKASGYRYAVLVYRAVDSHGDVVKTAAGSRTLLRVAFVGSI